MFKISDPSSPMTRMLNRLNIPEKDEENTTEPAQATPVSRVTETVTTPVSRVTETVTTPVSRVTEILTTPVSRVLETVTTPVAKVTETVTTSVSKVTETVTTPVSKVTETVTTPVSKVTETVTTPVSKVTETVTTSVSKVTETVTTPVSKVTETVTTPVSKVTETVTTPVSKVTETVTTPVSKVTETVTTPAEADTVISSVVREDRDVLVKTHTPQGEQTEAMCSDELVQATPVLNLHAQTELATPDTRMEAPDINKLVETSRVVTEQSEKAEQGSHSIDDNISHKAVDAVRNVCETESLSGTSAETSVQETVSCSSSYSGSEEKVSIPAASTDSNCSSSLEREVLSTGITLKEETMHGEETAHEEETSHKMETTHKERTADEEETTLGEETTPKEETTQKEETSQKEETMHKEETSQKEETTHKEGTADELEQSLPILAQDPVDSLKPVATEIGSSDFNIHVEMESPAGNQGPELSSDQEMAPTVIIQSLESQEEEEVVNNNDEVVTAPEGQCDVYSERLGDHLKENVADNSWFNMMRCNENDSINCVLDADVTTDEMSDSYAGDVSVNDSAVGCAESCQEASGSESQIEGLENEYDDVRREAGLSSNVGDGGVNDSAKQQKVECKVSQPELLIIGDNQSGKEAIEHSQDPAVPLMQDKSENTPDVVQSVQSHDELTQSEASKFDDPLRNNSDLETPSTDSNSQKSAENISQSDEDGNDIDESHDSKPNQSETTRSTESLQEEESAEVESLRPSGCVKRDSLQAALGNDEECEMEVKVIETDCMTHNKESNDEQSKTGSTHSLNRETSV